VTKIAKAVTLLALLAIVSACGSSAPLGPDVHARRLPSTLDLDRLAGMRIPGTPNCIFENESRTFLGSAWGSTGQDLLFYCRGDYPLGNVRTLDDEAQPVVAEQLQCQKEDKGRTHFHCAVRHKRLLAAATDWSETEARMMVTRVIDLLEPLAEGATPVIDLNLQALRATTDLTRLAGRPVPRGSLKGCVFDNAPVDHVGTSTATIGLQCRSSATGIVAIGKAPDAIPNAAPEVPDNIVLCSRGPRESDCYLRHGNVQLSTTVKCPTRCRDGATPSALMAQIARLLATLP
jgi:hypothetical protein